LNEQIPDGKSDISGVTGGGQHAEGDKGVAQPVAGASAQQPTGKDFFGGLGGSPGGPAQVPNVLAPIEEFRKMCYHHNQELRFFCDSCEEPICYDCTVMGPHNTQLHRIASTTDAFRARFDIINKAIHRTLLPKRQQLLAQITRLDYRLDEIKTVKGIIEKDVRNEYGAIMERLRSAEGVKLAVLQYDIAEIQKDITRIDEILKAMDELGGGSEMGIDMLGFLLRFRHLHENIDYAITKQFKVEIEVLPNDLPRELAERRVLMEHYEQ
jgi:hypothetical protein